MSPAKRKLKTNLIDITKILPKSMYSRYEALELPVPPNADKFIKDAFYALNLSRADPVFFVNTLMEPMRGRYQKRFLYKDYGDITRRTAEGIEASDAAIKYLTEHAEKTWGLIWSDQLANLAKNKITSLEIEPNATIKYSDLKNTRLEDYNINPDCQINEFAEKGSQLGFEAVVHILINDGDFKRHNKYIRDQTFKYVGIAFTNKHREYRWITYILVADETALDVENPVQLNASFKQEPKTSTFGKWFKKVPPKVVDTRKNANDTTRFEDKREVKKDETVLPFTNQYEENELTDLPPKINYKQADDEIFNIKHYQQATSKRETNRQPTLESRFESWDTSNLNRKEIIEKASIKPPSYFRINKI
jgi:hypothetical protein